MPYEFKRDDVYSFASSLGFETKEKGGELVWKYCPYCNGGSSRDEYTFSVNLDKGVFNCFRSSCGQQGHFVELCRDFDYKLDDYSPKYFKKLPQPKAKIEPKNEAVKYLESRGISEKIAKDYEITVRSDNKDILVFPFFDEQGELQFIKYRNTKFKKGITKGNKEWCEENTMPILFGMKQCVGFDRLIITEGQLDSLSVAECGFNNAVSVPTGANGFTWFIPCQEWIAKFKEIIVFGDFEHGKITLVDGLKSRLTQKIKVVRKKDYLGEKDANDILTKYGRKAIIKAIENAEIPRLENVQDLAMVESVDLNELPKLKTGIFDLDQALGGGMCLGQVILLTGKRGNGKSTLGSQIIANVLDQSTNVFAYSGELSSWNFKRWLDLQLAGKSNLVIRKNDFGDDVATIDEKIVKSINDWYRGRMFVYDNQYLPEDNAEFESLTVTIEKVIKQYGVQFVFIDNLMTAMDSVEDQDNLYLAQSNFVGTLKKLAMKYQVVIMLVAHPRKSKEEFQNDDVSGSSDITNKVDIVISYARDNEPNKGKLLVTKNRLFGVLKVGKDAIEMEYSTLTKRIRSRTTTENKQYGWEKQAIADGLEDLPFD